MSGTECGMSECDLETSTVRRRMSTRVVGPWEIRSDYKYSTVERRFMNLIRSWRPFVTRNVRKPELCVLSESYTATDALPPILPACRQPLLPACLFVTRDTVVTRGFFFSENLFVNRFVRDKRRL
jgi:hypothetical protein